MDPANQLDIPETARADRQAVELLRVWIANGGQHIALRSDVWEDPAAWGIMLGDLMQHIANSYVANEGFDRSATLERIKAGLDAELTSPTDTPRSS